MFQVISTGRRRLILIYTKWRPSTAGTNMMKRLHLLLKWNQNLKVAVPPNKLMKVIPFSGIRNICQRPGKRPVQMGERWGLGKGRGGGGGGRGREGGGGTGAVED